MLAGAHTHGQGTADAKPTPLRPPSVPHGCGWTACYYVLLLGYEGHCARQIPSCAVLPHCCNAGALAKIQIAVCCCSVFLACQVPIYQEQIKYLSKIFDCWCNESSSIGWDRAIISCAPKDIAWRVLCERYAAANANDIGRGHAPTACFRPCWPGCGRCWTGAFAVPFQPNNGNNPTPADICHTIGS